MGRTYWGKLTGGLHSVDMPGISLLVRERSSLYSPGAARAANGKISHDTAATAHLHGPGLGLQSVPSPAPLADSLAPTWRPPGTPPTQNARRRRPFVSPWATTQARSATTH